MSIEGCLPPSAAFCADIIDDATPLTFKKVSGHASELADLRTRPLWAYDQTGRRFLADGVPMVWHRASLLV